MALRAAVLARRKLDRVRIGSDKDWKKNFKRLDQIKEQLVNSILPLNMDEIETYGSMYLPSYRSKVLRDRIDY